MTGPAQMKPDSAAAAEVHVYASGSLFVVVPVRVDAEGKAREVMPVRRVKLVIGRATVVELTRALREASQWSTEGVVDEDDVAEWDGDNGRWWNHNLLSVSIRWSANGVTFTPQAPAPEADRVGMDLQRFSAGTSFGDLAEELVRALGVRLHG